MSMTHAPLAHARRTRINAWLVAVAALAGSLVALGTWVIVDRTSASKPAAVQLVDDLNAAVNAGDAKAVRALFAPAAVLQVSTGDTISGLNNIVNTALIPHGMGYRLERAAPVTTAGDSAATFTAYGGSGAHGIELAVFQFKAGKIARMWVYNEGYR